MLYIGAEYCPFCATERWAMVNALARFGTFTGLKITNSADRRRRPRHQDPVVLQVDLHQQLHRVHAGRDPEQHQGRPRDATAAQQAIEPSSKSGNGSIPFIYFNGEYLISGATYDVGVLQGKTWDQIAAAMNDPTSAVAKGAIGAANGMTATICLTTKNQPSSACSLPVIQTLESRSSPAQSSHHEHHQRQRPARAP